MISLSKLLKSSVVTKSSERRLIEAAEPWHTLHTGLEDDKPNDEAVDDITRETRKLISDAENLAEKHIQNAKQHVDELQKQVREEIEIWWQERRMADEEVRKEVYESAYQTGLEQGIEEGRRQAFEEQQQMLMEAKAVVEQAIASKSDIIAEAEPFLVELSTAIASKIIRAELQLESGHVLYIVRDALLKARGSQTLTLAVHPEQFSFVNQARSELLNLFDHLIDLVVVPDPTVSLGGCVIRSSYGSIDARVESQLDEIKKALLEMADHSNVESG